MKLAIASGILAAAASLTSCAFHGSGLVLDTIGPPPLASAVTGSNGTLRVFSAYEQGADFNNPYYRRRYTDYQVYSADGELVQSVGNDTGALVEAPRKLMLPAGTYRVVARANGYGVVTVPVVIRANQVTTVHLEGSPSWPNRAALGASNPVRLPDGEIAGWRASATSLSDPVGSGPVPAR